MEVEAYIAHLKKFDKSYINEQLLRIVQEASTFIFDLNQSQLLSGIRGDGEKLAPYASKKYAEYKNQLNPLPGLGTPDLKLSGSFYEEMYLQFNGAKGWPVEIFSRDSKASKLLSEYGKEALQLTEENIENLREHIEPKVQELYRRIFAV